MDSGTANIAEFRRQLANSLHDIRQQISEAQRDHDTSRTAELQQLADDMVRVDKAVEHYFQ